MWRIGGDKDGTSPVSETKEKKLPYCRAGNKAPPFLIRSFCLISHETPIQRQEYLVEEQAVGARYSQGQLSRW